MLDAGRDKDERSGRAGDFPTFQEDDVLAVKDVKSLGGIVVDVERWPEAGWFVGFQQREGPTRLDAGSLDRHLKPTQIDRPPLAGSQNNYFHGRQCRRPCSTAWS